jgi:hypothetical protein
MVNMLEKEQVNKVKRTKKKLVNFQDTFFGIVNDYIFYYMVVSLRKDEVEIWIYDVSHICNSVYKLYML